jgi:NADPH2:quinone reductase
VDKHWLVTQPGGLEMFSLEDYEVPPPGEGEVTIAVRAAGMNPADYKYAGRGNPEDFPVPVGYEVAGVLTAVGPGTEIASGGGAVGDEVLAYRVRGGWATALNVAAADVFAKPPSLGFEQAANLLLAGATAAEMLHVTGCTAGETILVHGASGAVGVSVLQQAALLGVRVLGTASEGRFDEVRRFGGEPVAYGEGLEDRVRRLAPQGVAAALDCVGTDEAVDVSLALVADRDRIVTIAAMARATEDGIVAIGGAKPSSKAFRDDVRARLVRLAGEGHLEVPVARTFPLEQAVEAAELLGSQHPGGKLALIP